MTIAKTDTPSVA